MKLSIAIAAVLFPVRLALIPLCKAANVNAQDPGLNMSNAFMLPINVATCPDGMQLQLDRALVDLDKLTTLGLYTLLNKPCLSSIQHYFGNVTDEADLTVPIGVLTRLQKGTKKRVTVRCDGIEKVCSKNKQVTIEGGYVMRAEDGTSSVMICPQNFLHQASSRKYLEDICQDDWTLNGNMPTAFWSASLLGLLMQVPELSSPMMNNTVRAYPNVLDMGLREPVTASHNIYTYLYFVLDLFAQKHVKGGCAGQPSGRVNETSERQPLL